MAWISESNQPQFECHECNGLGYVNCFCGGDQCVCGMDELPCHTCYPGHYAEDDEDSVPEEMASGNQNKAVELDEDEFIEKPDAICAHCDQEIFWWPMSHFWSHGTGPNAGLTNCHGIHNPSQNIINPGPFAEPKPAAVDVAKEK